MRFFSSLLAAFLIVALALATPAHAGPVVAAIGAIAGAIGSAISAIAASPILSLIASTALKFGVGLLRKALARKDQPERPRPGIKFDVQMGDDDPIAFPMGATATGGSRKYSNSWGSAGGTPRAYFVDVIQIADLPAPGRPGLFVNGQKCTVLWDEDPADQGYPVEEFRIDGTDYLWVRYNDGTQTEADPYLLAKFGADPDRPWKTSMIGRGAPHLVFTARLNRSLFPGQLVWLIEPPKTAWYDVRQDTTAGGDGTHRWADPATWAPSENPAVMIYNIIRGVYYGEEWLYGGRGLAAFRLPSASWMAAMNECDALVERADGTSEAQFRAGLEIRGDMQPLDAIEELRKACSGRIAEVGGIFKMMVGAPPGAVYAFTDADILITKGQSLTPFPSLDETYNGVEATYPEPAEAWATKDAPARYDAGLEAEDGGRRLASGLDFKAVPYARQVQQLMETALKDHRRFAIHNFFLPPDAAGLEPGVDVVSWTSAANGYANKKFLVSRADGERTRNVQVVIEEIDPADYGWSSAMELPVSTGPLGPIRPAPQPMTGWQVFPAEFASGGKTVPSIGIAFAGALDDVRAARVQVRLAADESLVFDGELPYGDPDPANDPRQVILNATFLADTDYEARGILVPFSGRAASWSDWLPVTTEKGGYAVFPVNLKDLGDDVKELQQWSGAQTRELIDQVRRLSAVSAAADLGGYAQAQQLRREAKATTDRITAAYEEAITAAVGPESAIVAQLTQLQATVDDDLAEAVDTLTTQINSVGGETTANSNALTALTATVGDISSNVTVRGTAVAGGLGGEASWGVELKTGSGDTWSSMGIYARVHDGIGEAVLIADRVLIADPDDLDSLANAFLVQDGVTYLDEVKIGTANIDDAAITSTKIQPLEVVTV